MMMSSNRIKCKPKRSSPSRESPPLPTRFGTAFANLLLSLSSGWALRMTGGFQRPQPSVVTFTLFLVHSVLGVVRFGNPQYGDALRLVYENTGFLCIVVALPWYTHNIYDTYDIFGTDSGRMALCFQVLW